MLFFATPALLYAQGSPLDELPGIDLKFGDVYCIFLRVMTWFFSIALVLAIILLIVNGLRYIFAGGSPEAINKAHKNFAWIGVGIVVILFSVSIILIVANFLGVFTTNIDLFLLPAKSITCDVVWWADLIQDVISIFGAGV